MTRFVRTKFIGVCLAFVFVLFGGAHSPSFAVVGAKCGGFAGQTCGPHEFCEKPTGACFFPDIWGTCVSKPVICPLAKSANVVLPVCGCDSKTYANDCIRMRAGVSKAHDGTCF
jgi:Kazal-type serine protease inhibitor domain